MQDRFQLFSNAATVTPSDTVDLPHIGLAILLGTASTNLKVDTLGGQTLDLGVCAAGIVPICVKRIYATPAPPSGIKVLW